MCLASLIFPVEELRDKKEMEIIEKRYHIPTWQMGNPVSNRDDP